MKKIFRIVCGVASTLCAIFVFLMAYLGAFILKGVIKIGISKEKAQEIKYILKASNDYRETGGSSVHPYREEIKNLTISPWRKALLGILV